MTHPNPSDSRQERIAELEHIREPIVLAIAFLSRDNGTDRQKHTTLQIIVELAKADQRLLSELSRLRNESGGGEARESIPEGIYAAEGNFYSVQDMCGMGWEFYNKWRSRMLEFPGRELLNTEPGAAQAEPVAWQPFQDRVQFWMLACFGPEISRDKVERNHRFLEESLELVQSLGCTRSEAHQLVDYVFDREAGEPDQETGGVEVTLAALCLANDLNMQEAGERELKRIWQKIDKIRAKQAAKPRHSPLPQTSAAPQPDALRKALEEEETERAAQVADGLRLPPPNKEHIARSLWESQRARIKNQDGINARLSWRDKSVPFAFWHHYELDADAVIAALSTPAPAQSDERAGLERAAKWHDGMITDYEQQIEKARGDGSDSGLILGTLAILRDEHKEAASALRSLAQGDRSDG